MTIKRACTFLTLGGLVLGLTGCPTTTRFNSQPEGATVYLDGERLGTTPLIYNDRGSLPKRHRLQVELEGYQTEEFFIDREMALLYTVLAGPVYGVPLLWAYWMPDRVMMNLRPEEGEAVEEPAAEPEPSQPEAEEPAPPPPTSETPTSPPPSPAEPEPLNPPSNEEPEGEPEEEQAPEPEEEEEEPVPPPPPPPPPLD